MSFYDAFEARAEEYAMEKEAIAFKPRGSLKDVGAREWLRRRLNPTRGERLVDVLKGKADTARKGVEKKFDEAFPTRGMQMRRAAWRGTKAGAGAAARGATAAAKGLASGAKTLKQKLTPKPKLSPTQRLTAATKAKLQSLPPKVKANWNKLSDTQKAVALGSGTAALGAGATYAATRNRD